MPKDSTSLPAPALTDVWPNMAPVVRELLPPPREMSLPETAPSSFMVSLPPPFMVEALTAPDTVSALFAAARSSVAQESEDSAVEDATAWVRRSGFEKLDRELRWT